MINKMQLNGAYTISPRKGVIIMGWELFGQIAGAVAAIIGLIGALMGLKNVKNAPIIIEKNVYYYDKNEKSTNAKREANRNNNRTTLDKLESSDMLILLVLAFVALCAAIWFNRKYHDIVVAITSGLALVIVILNTVYINKNSISVNKTIRDLLFFAQPIAFILTQKLFYNSFDFAKMDILFASAHSWNETYSVFLSNILDVTTYGLYHFLDVMFYFLLSISMVVFILRLGHALSNKDIKFINILEKRLHSNVILFLPVISIVMNLIYYIYYTFQPVQ